MGAVMANPPIGLEVICPECGADAVAIVPRDSTIIEQEKEADGKVWVNCRACDSKFIVFYRTKE